MDDRRAGERAMAEPQRDTLQRRDRRARRSRQEHRGRAAARRHRRAAAGKLEPVRRECERTGKPFEYAFLLDALTDEQDQGITIDTARCFFKSATRDYIIIDAPGHIEFLKNMISGAARAEAAVLVIDAKEGVRENSRRHGYILSMLGIRQVVVCVNKMDLVGYDEDHFQRIEAEYRAFLRGIGAVSPRAFIPVSAFRGDEPGRRARRGDALVRRARRCSSARRASQGAVQERPAAAHAGAGGLQVHRATATTAASSPAASRPGRCAVGDKVVFSPSNKISTIKSIEGFNAPPRTEIDAGWSTGFTLTEEIYVTRGEVMSHVEQLAAGLHALAHQPDLARQEAVRRAGATTS